MKVTVVPAQVTTVEDRIIGSLTFSQMLLLVAPIFLSAGLFALLPPFMAGSLYKYVLIGTSGLLGCFLAIRIRGKILAVWLLVLLRYNLRPTFHLFNKNTQITRERYELEYEVTEATQKNAVQKHHRALPHLAFTDSIQALATIENPAANVRFETTKKGGLNVRLTEIQD